MQHYFSLIGNTNQDKTLAKFYIFYDSTLCLYPWLFNLHKFSIFLPLAYFIKNDFQTTCIALLGLALIEVGSFSKLLLSYSTNTPFKHL